ncbi:MAG: RNA degradosome polyphosphate kinase [Epsilonproteobacteria bacterium]|nr:RNA degradosome polyphosphate kinase [Campylobacterota bacterium]
MIDLNSPELYANRELSWLRFNTRVIKQSQKESNPLLERLKFIAIYSTNLDEFYMIRVAGLQELYSARVNTTGLDNLTPREQLDSIHEYIADEKEVVEQNYSDIVTKLKSEDLFIQEYNDLNKSLKKDADDFFYENIFPVIIPIAVDATHPFPPLNNLSLSLAVQLQDSSAGGEIKYAMIRIPRLLPRFVHLTDGIYITIESLVREHADDIFPGYEILSTATFRVTRNADIVIEEEEADDFMEILEQGLRRRKKGAFVRLEVEEKCDVELLDFLVTHLGINEQDIYTFNIPLNLGALWTVIADKQFSHLNLPLHQPKVLPPFDQNESIFQVLDREDVMTMQPFESFDPVVKFIQDAAKDPKVLSIRMTLYRVGKNSPIVQALIDAANNGKQVTAMVELKARFDEENNLIWAKALEESGAHVIYGIPGFKVHGKIAQVIRKSEDKLKIYLHFSTGNYNETTAKLYTDISYFTSRAEFRADSITFFHILTGFSKNKMLNNLKMSPHQMKASLLEMIKKEREKGADGRIIAKMNSLVDTDIIKALYKASMEGVKIDLLIRGICCLRPGIKGISENIHVRSIIGKYLEHSRIFYFKNASPQTYISSADWMPRNLEKRFELMVPIYDTTLSLKLKDYLNLQINDNVLSWDMNSDGNYKKFKPEKNMQEINSQAYLEQYVNKIYKVNSKTTVSVRTPKTKKIFK